jgi:DNA-binding transcriptional regulator YiaG
MTPKELQRILAQLGISRGKFGELLGATRRSGENWTDPDRSDVPGPVATIARLLEKRPELVHLIREDKP